jgi:thioredoxin reductase
MNRQFDVIVVGDSKAGNSTIKSIAGANRKIKTAFISREFKQSTTRDFLNVEYIKGEVTFTDYKNRLFCCYLANGDRYYCTHLIIASGLGYAPFKIGNKTLAGVLNTINEIPKAANTKGHVAIVVGNRDADVKLAFAVAKKYKYVYLCTESMKLDVTEATRKKLETTENLLTLYNTSITKAVFEEDHLISVALSSYSKITCNAIFAITEAAPETTFVSEKLISKENGYLVTSNIAQSLLVPKCFAIGSCASKSTKKMQAAMIESVLKDFNGG